MTRVLVASQWVLKTWTSWLCVFSCPGWSTVYTYPWTKRKKLFTNITGCLVACLIHKSFCCSCKMFENLNFDLELFGRKDLVAVSDWSAPFNVTVITILGLLLWEQGDLDHENCFSENENLYKCGENVEEGKKHSDQSLLVSGDSYDYDPSSSLWENVP